MVRRAVILSSLILLIASDWSCSNRQGSASNQNQTAIATRRALKVIVNTNGVIEPLDRSEIFAPTDAIVAHLPIHEGDKVDKGQLLIRLHSNLLETALVEARASLLQARRQA